MGTHPQRRRLVAERLGVHPVSVQRNQPRAQARFAELLADPAHQEASEHAAELGGRLGPYSSGPSSTRVVFSYCLHCFFLTR